MTVLSKKKAQALSEECEPSSSAHGHVLPLSTTQTHSQVNNNLQSYFINFSALYQNKMVCLILPYLLNLYFNLDILSYICNR